MLPPHTAYFRKNAGIDVDAMRPVVRQALQMVAEASNRTFEL